MNSAARTGDNLGGILMMVTSMALFAIEDMFIKFAAAAMPVGQIVFVSGIFGLPVFCWLAHRQGRRVFSRSIWSMPVLLRNLGEMVGTLGFVTALASVPLATVAAVLQAMPLAVTLGAALFLREAVGWRRWTAIAVGFAGVLIVIRPGMDGFRPEALWVLLTVAGLALRDLASRAIPAECSDAQVSAWGLMAVTLLGALMMAGHGAVKVPEPGQVLFLIGAVAFGTGGYWAITAASRTGEVSVVAPFRYTRLVFAIVIAMVFFGEYPDTATLIGASLIIASGLYAFARERQRKRGLSLPATLR
jgi:drug/metabolite transporter (DMT)-like permease